ncbi:Fe-S cluster assembly protein SufD [Chelatococcus sp. SYSU_G07232]|uniref:Fe-S cluster assembly protein SufD n=1 Tax=Chelatococcus albus TaxID=3047466 RepID=A0ABT7ABG9_9HYPH|nr:Fe-S cluster assembly protein SufD [Chelatococcus sp. SYSU_G07232]MDJ1156721.1 Fe-S cluster assembly protein SufD [Chelatococcus sp. SYSU_G07232]
MSAEVTPIRTAAETALIERFKAAKGELPGDGEVAKRREEAFARIEAAGLPHRRVEEWKYTDLRGLMREAAPLAPLPSAAEAAGAIAAAEAFAAVDAVRLTFVNGHFLPGASSTGGLPAGVEIVPLAEALASGHALLREMGRVAVGKDNAALALNAAFMADGAVIRVADGVPVAQPLHLRFVNTGAAPFATSPRVLVAVGEGASVTLLETHEGTAGVAYQTNTVVEIFAGAGTNVSHVRLNAEGDGALALSTLAVSLGAEALFNTLGVVTGSAAARHQLFLAFEGEGSKVSIGGATMIGGRQHADTTLVVDHAVPGCESRELFKTVVDGEATGVFQGKIIVRPDAQKTDGRMMSAALLLSETGTMNNKPELEIFADDVQCAHGATCGALDEDLLFYLMARGLPRGEAEALLVQAFLGEAIELVAHEGVREALLGRTAAWLAARAA